ncbi:MAG: tetraprenyl-beta-curcumene synthase family protein [Chloroflexi bacterium]|nr:tetraprenyl-beta-curcumene synthase family protein [Chloroflexota bacterium]
MKEYKCPGAGLLALAKLSWRHVFEVLPLAAVELDGKWRVRASAIPDPEIRKQALDSLHKKRFHAEGGCAYSLTPDGVNHSLVSLIVAIQTISDYLDNLCDRSGAGEPEDFRRLHDAWMDAFATDGRTGDYYALHPQREDGGYLKSLVRECQRQLVGLPSYHVVSGDVQRLALLYADLQVYKHQLPVARRVPSLEAWHEREWDDSLYWWEFAAACGSTLGIFALLRAAAKPGLAPTEAKDICSAYFPAVCATHILLDYFIDQAEDAAGGDLNLVSYYSSPEERDQRLRKILGDALQRVATLPDAAFHSWIVTGLPALYLSGQKVQQQHLQSTRKLLVNETGRKGQALQFFIRLHKLSAPGRKTYRGQD